MPSLSLPEKAPYHHFSIDDFPAYEFAPDGTPTRVVPTSRGSKWTGALSPYVNARGYELFGMTRKDGTRKFVTRSTILKALGQDVVGAREPEDPFTNPDRKPFLPNYPDYAVAKDGSVVRFQSPGRGRYFRPRPVGTVREHYVVLDSIAGSRDYIRVDKIAKLAGW